LGGTAEIGKYGERRVSRPEGTWTLVIRPVQSHDALLADIRASNRHDGSFRLWWLGQSGFLLSYESKCILLDPYLSDSLTEKYAGTDKPHVRKRVDWKRIGRLFAPYWKQQSLVLACIVISAVIGLAPAYLIAHIIDKAIPNRDFHQVALDVGGMLASERATTALRIAPQMGSGWTWAAGRIAQRRWKAGVSSAQRPTVVLRDTWREPCRG